MVTVSNSMLVESSYSWSGLYSPEEAQHRNEALKCSTLQSIAVQRQCGRRGTKKGSVSNDRQPRKKQHKEVRGERVLGRRAVDRPGQTKTNLRFGNQQLLDNIRENSFTRELLPEQQQQLYYYLHPYLCILPFAFDQ